MSVNKQLDRKKIILREINIHVPDEDMPYYSQALDDLITSEKAKELELMWNNTQPDLVPEGWTPENPEAKYLQKRINELRSIK